MAKLSIGAAPKAHSTIYTGNCTTDLNVMQNTSDIAPAGTIVNRHQLIMKMSIDFAIFIDLIGLIGLIGSIDNLANYRHTCFFYRHI